MSLWLEIYFYKSKGFSDHSLNYTAEKTWVFTRTVLQNDKSTELDELW